MSKDSAVKVGDIKHWNGKKVRVVKLYGGFHLCEVVELDADNYPLFITTVVDFCALTDVPESGTSIPLSWFGTQLRLDEVMS